MAAVMVSSCSNGFYQNNVVNKQTPSKNSNTPLLRGNRPRISANMHTSNELHLAVDNLHLPQINSQSALISNQCPQPVKQPPTSAGPDPVQGKAHNKRKHYINNAGAGVQ